MENNGKGIFYGVIGVATLIVAIIGATFAYFTATASNNTTIAGNAASVGLNLSVEKVSSGDKGLVPQLEETLNNAMVGTDGQTCVDANNNTVCQVYNITVQNTGTAEAKLSGTLTLTKGNVKNLKWATVTGWGSSPTAGEEVVNDVLVDSVTISGSGSQEYYAVIWIDETTEAQDDSGTFTGTVTFNAADGSGVTSTFTA